MFETVASEHCTHIPSTHPSRNPSSTNITPKRVNVLKPWPSASEIFENGGAPLAFVLYSPDENAPLDRLKDALKPYCLGNVELWLGPTDIAESKPQESRWEGDDDAWDRFLSDGLTPAHLRNPGPFLNKRPSPWPRPPGYGRAWIKVGPAYQSSETRVTTRILSTTTGLFKTSVQFWNMRPAQVLG